MRFVIVTGMSGAGRSTALRVLEDAGYFCVDNLPISLIEKFSELIYPGNTEVTKVALGIDTRRIEDLVRQSRNGHPKCEIDLLRVCIISVTCFLCHISVRFSISNATKRQSAGYPPGREKAVDTEWFHSYKNAPARLPADSSGVCRKQSEAFRPRRLHFVQRYE